MNYEILHDLRCYVSDCFNHRGYMHDGKTRDESGYTRLSNLMIQEYDLTHSDVDTVVHDIEELVANYIFESSMKFHPEQED